MKSIRRCEQSTGGSINGSSSSSSTAGSTGKGKKKKKAQKSSKHGAGDSATKGRGANRVQSRKNAVVKVEPREKSNYSSSSSVKHVVGTTTIATTSTVHKQVESFRPLSKTTTPYPAFSSNNFSRSTNVSDDEQDSDNEQRGRGASPSYYHYPGPTSSSTAAHFDHFGCNVSTNNISAVQEFLPENPVSNNMAVVDGTHDMEELSFLEGVTDINEFMERQPSTLVLDDDGSVSLDDEIDFDTIFEVGVGVGVEC